MKKIILPIFLVIFFISCQNKNSGNTQSGNEQQKKSERKTEMKLTSSAFEDGGKIPSKYTCDGENISPPLSWINVPEGTKCFIMTCDDPDAPAGNWIHWVIYNISPDIKELKENVPAEKTSENIYKQGLNDFGKIGYGGPCPPGGTHRYIFTLYAVNKVIDVEPSPKKSAVLKAMEGSILAQAQLTGKYSRE